MPLGDAGSYSNLPFGDYTHEIARRLGCDVNEVDSIMLTAPQWKSSEFMAPGLKTGSVDAAAGELVLRIPGAIGKLISKLSVKYTINQNRAHGEILTRFGEPDLLASIDVSQSGEPIGMGHQERELQATAQVRAIQTWLGGGHQGQRAYNLGLEKKAGFEFQGALLPTTVKRRTTLAGPAGATGVVGRRNLVDAPFIATTTTGANSAQAAVTDDFVFKDTLARVGANAVDAARPVAKEFPLSHLMKSDWLRTEQSLTCYSPTVVRLRTHPLVPVAICNHSPADATTATTGANHEVVAAADFQKAAGNNSIQLEWCERFVSQPRYQAILDAVIGKEYTFPAFEIRGTQINQLDGESAMNGRCVAGPGKVHWVMASLQVGQQPRLFPSDGKFFSDFRFDQLDVSMHATEDTGSQAQKSMRKRRYDLSQMVFNNPSITEGMFSDSHVVVIPVGYGAKTAGGGNLANQYHGTHMPEAVVNCRSEAAGDGILLVGIGKETAITFLGASSQTPGAKVVVKM